jgi:hypothetical protein
MQLSKDGQKVVGSKINLSCDCLECQVDGHQQFIYLLNLVVSLKFREEDQVFIPNIYPSDQISVGSCNGDFTLDEILINTPNHL